MGETGKVHIESPVRTGKTLCGRPVSNLDAPWITAHQTATVAPTCNKCIQIVRGADTGTRHPYEESGGNDE